MPSTVPFSQLTGAWSMYLAPKIEPETVVNIAPAGNWLLIGATDGDQKVKHAGPLTFFRDNDHTGPRALPWNQGITASFRLFRGGGCDLFDDLMEHQHSHLDPGEDRDQLGRRRHLSDCGKRRQHSKPFAG